MADQHRIGAELKSSENGARGLSHGRPHLGDVVLEAINRGADQHGIVHRRADLDRTFGCQTAREP
jgi:hypothetical protein